MDPIFLVLAAIPLAAAGIQFILLPRTFSWREAAVQGLLCTLIVVVVWNFGRYADAGDVEIWNGSVSAKEAIRKDCPYGWVQSTDRHCTHYRTRSVKAGETCSTVDGERVCTPYYRTEYDYIYPWEQRYWIVSRDIDLRLEYTRVDPQGVRTPPTFAAISVGDPAARTMAYDNWVRGAADSLFHEDGATAERYADLIPEYPIALYDGINVDRVIGVGVPIDARSWSRDLSRSLSTLGPQRQMNAVLLLVDAAKMNEDYIYAVRRAWRGFKKNDVVLFVGVDADLAVRWVRSLSWSSSSMFDVAMQNDLQDLRGQPLTSAAVNEILLRNGMAHYQRRSMKEFEYLKESIPVPGWLYALVALLSIGGTAGVSYIFHRTEF